jgi:hypothetical protein
MGEPQQFSAALIRAALTAEGNRHKIRGEKNSMRTTIPFLMQSIRLTKSVRASSKLLLKLGWQVSLEIGMAGLKFYTSTSPRPASVSHRKILHREKERERINRYRLRNHQYVQPCFRSRGKVELGRRQEKTL